MLGECADVRQDTLLHESVGRIQHSISISEAWADRLGNSFLYVRRAYVLGIHTDRTPTSLDMECDVVDKLDIRVLVRRMRTDVSQSKYGRQHPSPIFETMLTFDTSPQVVWSYGNSSNSHVRSHCH